MHPQLAIHRRLTQIATLRAQQIPTKLVVVPIESVFITVLKHLSVVLLLLPMAL